MNARTRANGRRPPRDVPEVRREASDGVDVTQIDQLMRLTVEQRIAMLSKLASSMLELRHAARV